MASISAAITLFVRTAAIAGRLSAAYHAVYNGGGTADAFIYAKRPEGAITDTGSAFHAPVTVQNDCFPVFQGKDPMRAYFEAHPAARTTLGKELKTCDA
jgi:hypothetical protein